MRAAQRETREPQFGGPFPEETMTKRKAWSFLAGAAAGLVLVLQGVPVLAVPVLAAGAAASTPRTLQEQPAALTITVRTCPAGYDPLAANAAFETDCREPAGDTVFGLQLAGTQARGPSAGSGTSGDAPQESTLGFTGLMPGRYTVTAAAPPEIGAAFVGRCTSDKRSFEDYPFVPFAVANAEGSVVLTLVPGETLACDWYQIAAEKQS
jgi:hypothetical protein